MFTNPKKGVLIEPLLAEGGEDKSSQHLDSQSTDSSKKSTSATEKILDQAAIVSTFKELEIGAPTPFYRWNTDDKTSEGERKDGPAEPDDAINGEEEDEPVDSIGFAYYDNTSKFLIAEKSKVMLHDLNKQGEEPEVIYENKIEGGFNFEYLRKRDKLLLVSENKITIVDLKDENKVVLEITAEDNELLDGLYKDQEGDSHLHVNEKYIIRLQEKFILRIDIDLLLNEEASEPAIIRTGIENYASINDLDKKDEEYTFCKVQCNDESNKLYVMLAFEDGNEFAELTLDTLVWDCKLGPTLVDIVAFSYAEDTRKLYTYNQVRSELNLMTLKLENSEQIEEGQVEAPATGDCLLIWPEKQMIFVGGNDIRVFDMKSLTKLATLKIEGDTLLMRLTPKKNKLFVLTEGAYYDFNINSIARSTHELGDVYRTYETRSTSKLYLMDNEDGVYSVKGYDFEQKTLGEPLHTLEKGTEDDLWFAIGEKEQYGFLAFISNKDMTIQKIDMKTNNCEKSIKISDIIKDSDKIQSYQYTNRIFVCNPKDKQEELLVIVQACLDDGTYVQSLFLLSCNDLSVTSSSNFKFEDISFNKTYPITKQMNQFFICYGEKIFTLIVNENKKIEVKQLCESDQTISDIAVSSKYTALYNDDNTVSIYLTEHLKQQKLIKQMQFLPEGDIITDMCFVGTEETCRLALADWQGKLIFYCVTDQTIISEDNSKLQGSHRCLVYDQLRNNLCIFNNNRSDGKFESFSLNVCKSDIQNDINSSLQDNINKHFLASNKHDDLKHIVKFVKTNARYLANKLNMLSFSTFLSNTEAMKVLDKGQKILATFEKKTLIEKCQETGDVNSFNVCLEKIAESKRIGDIYFNQETLGEIIESEQQDLTINFLMQVLVQPAKFAGEALKMLPLKGEIKEEYIVTDSETLTLEDLKGVVQQSTDKEKQKKVEIHTICCKVQLSLANKDCQEFLQNYLEAPDEHLQVDKTSLYIDVMWNENWNKIVLFYMSKAMAFVFLAGTVILAPGSYTLFIINAVIAGLFILDECRQLKKEGWDYFTDLYNYLDISGSVSVITSAVLLYQKTADEFYGDNSNTIFLILGVMLFGLRALTSLSIFKAFRVQVTLFKQVLIDIPYFVSICILLVVIMAIVYGVETAMKPDEETKVASITNGNMSKNFFLNVGVFYMFMNGELPYGEDEELSFISWMVYVIFTMLIQVIALNLLVAVLSETFANVYAKMEANHCRIQASMLYELSGLMWLVKDNSERKNLHFVRYFSEKFEDLNAAELMRQSMKHMQEQLDSLQVVQEKMNKHIRDNHRKTDVKLEKIMRHLKLA